MILIYDIEFSKHAMWYFIKANSPRSRIAISRLANAVNIKATSYPNAIYPASSPYAAEAGLHGLAALAAQ